jgi:poly(A) polymerase
MEMRRILEDPHRAVGMRLLVETGLAAVILPEITRPHPNLPLEGERKLEINSPRASSPPNGEGEPETLLLQREKQDRGDDEASWRLTRSLAVIDRLDRPSFPLVLAAILYPHVDAEGAQEVGLRWRLSNQEIDRLTWLVAHHADLRAVRMKRWSELQPLLVAEGIEDLIALTEAERRVEGGDLEELAWLRSLLARPREELDPPPLLTGDDLIAHGIPPGPVYRTLLDRVRQAQLDGEIHTREEAIALVDRFLGES